MQSISKFEFKGLEILLRYFDEPMTVRQIAFKVGASPPALHKGFKKFHEEGILKGRRFGNAMFYLLNWDHPITFHLANVIMLLRPIEGKLRTSLAGLKATTAAVLAVRERVLVVSSMAVEETIPPHLKPLQINEQEFMERLKARDKEVMAFIREGKVVSGESFLVKAIKNQSMRM